MHARLWSGFWALDGVDTSITLWALSKLINEECNCDYSDLFSTLGFLFVLGCFSLSPLNQHCSELKDPFGADGC